MKTFFSVLSQLSRIELSLVGIFPRADSAPHDASLAVHPRCFGCIENLLFSTFSLLTIIILSLDCLEEFFTSAIYKKKSRLVSG